MQEPYMNWQDEAQFLERKVILNNVTKDVFVIE